MSPPFKGWDEAYDDRDDVSLIAMREGLIMRGVVFDPTGKFAVLNPEGEIIDSDRAREYVAKHGKPDRAAAEAIREATIKKFRGG